MVLFQEQWKVKTYQGAIVLIEGNLSKEVLPLSDPKIHWIERRNDTIDGIGGLAFTHSCAARDGGGGGYESVTHPGTPCAHPQDEAEAEGT